MPLFPQYGELWLICPSCTPRLLLPLSGLHQGLRICQLGLQRLLLPVGLVLGGAGPALVVGMSLSLLQPEHRSTSHLETEGPRTSWAPVLEINLQVSVWGREPVMKVGREGGGERKRTGRENSETKAPHHSSPSRKEPRNPQTQLGPVTKTPRHTLTSGPRWGWRWRPPWGQHRRAAQGISHPAQDTAAMLDLRSKHEVRAPETPQHHHHHHHHPPAHPGSACPEVLTSCSSPFRRCSYSRICRRCFRAVSTLGMGTQSIRPGQALA